MKVTIQRPESKPPGISVGSMNYGAVGIILDGSHKDEIVMRSYKSLISLSHPATAWRWDDIVCGFPKFHVELLPPGTLVTFTL